MLINLGFAVPIMEGFGSRGRRLDVRSLQHGGLIIIIAIGPQWKNFGWSRHTELKGYRVYSVVQQNNYFNAFFICCGRSSGISAQGVIDKSRPLTDSISSRSLVSIRTICLPVACSICSICVHVRLSWTKFIEIPFLPKRPVRPVDDEHVSDHLN